MRQTEDSRHEAVTCQEGRRAFGASRICDVRTRAEPVPNVLRFATSSKFPYGAWLGHQVNDCMDMFGEPRQEYACAFVDLQQKQRDHGH